MFVQICYRATAGIVEPREGIVGVQLEILAMEVKYHSIGRLDDKVSSRNIGVD